MGDRRNVELRYGNNHGSIYLYTHWQGTQLPFIVAEALNSSAGRRRWEDEAYLARIIFSRMTEGADPETGFGIAPYLQDENWPSIIVDLKNQTVNGVSYQHFIDDVLVASVGWPLSEGR